MSNYEELIKFRDRIVNDNFFTIYEEDGQLLDRVLDDYEKTDQQISQLKAENERLKLIDKFKENYGYTNYEDEYMLEDLQSRAFQSEDDTEVVNKILDYLNIEDENEILPIFEQQLKEKDTHIEALNKRWNELWQIYSRLGVEAFGDDIQEQALKEIAKLQRKDNTKKLKKQLAEKDAEIETLKEEKKQQIDSSTYFMYESANKTAEIEDLKQQLKTNTHQVCEKIRDRLKDLRNLEISAVRESREFEFKTEDARLEWIKIKTESAKIYDGVIKFLDQLENTEE